MQAARGRRGRGSKRKEGPSVRDRLAKKLLKSRARERMDDEIATLESEHGREMVAMRWENK